MKKIITTVLIATSLFSTAAYAKKTTLGSMINAFETDEGAHGLILGAVNGVSTGLYMAGVECRDVKLYNIKNDRDVARVVVKAIKNDATAMNKPYLDWLPVIYAATVKAFDCDAPKTTRSKR